MKIPEIERDLKGRVDPRVIYHLQRMQEQVIAAEQAIQGCAKVIAGVTEVLQNINAVNAQLNAKWNNQLGRNQSQGEMVESVLTKPDSDDDGKPN